MANINDPHHVVQKLSEIAWELESSPFNMSADCSGTTFDLRQGRDRVIYADLGKGVAYPYAMSRCGKYQNPILNALESAGVEVKFPSSHNLR